MIPPEGFYRALAEAGVNFAVGVPDSLLKEFCAFASRALPADRHIIAANEGTAVGIAAGVHLATDGVPLVYLQNSGLGNAINPLLSLADPEVYGVPLVLLVGWRGRPGIPDEPQHQKQGRVSPALLDAMEIPWKSLTGNREEALAAARWSLAEARRRSGPVVLLAQEGIFEKSPGHASTEVVNTSGFLAREEAIEIVTQALPEDAVVVSTTGKISRELYERRGAAGQGRASDFLTVGSMGHASQIALGIALMRDDRPVVCLDGDGAALMHLGGLATIGVSGAPRYLHIVLNNGVHDSVGGQPTAAFDVSLTGVARACSYKQILGPMESEGEIREALASLLAGQGPSFLEIRVKPGARPDLGRPKESPRENKGFFIERLRTSAVADS